MTTPHRTLQMALDALYSGESPPNARQQDAIAALREALAADHFRDVAEKAAPAAPVPDGWVMVPREPNEAMMDAGERAFIATARPGATWAEHTGNIYRAMIAASPAAPAAPVVRELQDDLIESVIRDVAELDYSSLPDMPEVMLVTANELRGILQAHGITGGKP